MVQCTLVLRPFSENMLHERMLCKLVALVQYALADLS